MFWFTYEFNTITQCYGPLIYLQRDDIADFRQFVVFYVCYAMILIEFITHGMSDVNAMGDAYTLRKSKTPTDEEKTPLLEEKTKHVATKDRKAVRDISIYDLYIFSK